MMKTAGSIELGVIGEIGCHLENFVGGKVSLVLADGSTVEFDIVEVLHSNLKAIDENGNEI